MKDIEWKLPIDLDDMGKVCSAVNRIVESFTQHSLVVAEELANNHPILSANCSKIVAWHLQEMSYLLTLEGQMKQALLDLYFTSEKGGKA